MTKPASGKIKLSVSLNEDEEFRALVRDLITGAVKSILKEELIEITANIIKNAKMPSEYAVIRVVERYAERAYEEAMEVATDKLSAQYQSAIDKHFEGQKDQLNKDLYIHAEKYVDGALLDKAFKRIAKRIYEMPITVSVNK